MKLYGSTTSPFVRRIRLLLADYDYQFIDLDIFSTEGQEALKAKNPTMKVPFIEDDGLVIYDSRVIFRYLSNKLSLANLTWQQENLLTLIDSANDTLVQLLLLQRSGFDTDEDKLYFNLQKGRLTEIFQTLNESVGNGEMSEWTYPAICLFTLVDWAQFRELFNFTHFENLQHFVIQSCSHHMVQETDPR